MSDRTVGEELIEAMGEVVSHVLGELELPERVVRVPARGVKPPTKN